MKKLYGRIFKVDPDAEVIVWMNWQNEGNLTTESITEWIYFKRKLIPTLILVIGFIFIAIFSSCNNERTPIKQVRGIVTDKYIVDNGEWAGQQYVHYLRIQTNLGIFWYHCGRGHCAGEGADYYGYDVNDSVRIEYYQGEEHDNNVWGIRHTSQIF